MLFKMLPPVTKDYAERMGYDAELNGANTSNCHFSLFGTPELTKAWESGKRRGAEAKRKPMENKAIDCN